MTTIVAGTAGSASPPVSSSGLVKTTGNSKANIDVALEYSGKLFSSRTMVGAEAFVDQLSIVGKGLLFGPLIQNNGGGTKIWECELEIDGVVIWESLYTQSASIYWDITGGCGRYGIPFNTSVIYRTKQNTAGAGNLCSIQYEYYLTE